MQPTKPSFVGVLTTLVAVTAIAGLSSCGAARFETTWTAPGADPIAAAPGAQVAAVVIWDDPVSRRIFERLLATEMTERGEIFGVPSFTLFDGDVSDEDAARTAFEQAGAVAAVVMRVVSVNEEIRFNPGVYYNQPNYSGFWSGYYGYSWNAVSAPSYISNERTVDIETLVYDLEQNVLLWAGVTETTIPDEWSELMSSLVSSAIREMRRAGVIAQ